MRGGVEAWVEGGWSLDLFQPSKVTGKTWDCRVAADRVWVKKRIHEDKPELIVVCPPCTLFSSLQNLSPNALPSEPCPDRWREALEMLGFAVEICLIQHRAGRFFLFELPSTATSWEDECLKGLVQTAGVLTSLLDMCRYGMVATDGDGEAPVRKTIRIATNSPEVADVFSVRCEGGRRHVLLVSGRPKFAAVYPPGFCRAIVAGFALHRLRDEAGGTWSGDMGLFERDLANIWLA